MRFRTAVAGAGLTALLFAGPLAAQPAPPAQPTPSMPATNANLTSQDFVTRAAIGDRYEIGAAKIAGERSRNPEIDRFAARMLHDHSQSTARLKQAVAHTGNLYLPAQLDAQHRGMIRELRQVGGPQFNQTYIQQQVQAHEDAVAIFSAYKRNADNPRLRRFASEILPIIRDHLEMARTLPGGPQIARGR